MDVNGYHRPDETGTDKLREKRVLRFDKIFETDIIYESQDEFEKSIFRDEFRHAERILEHILTQNERLTSKRNDIREQRVFNTISFIGKRGAGKTSAMLSYLNSLGNHIERQNGNKYSGDRVHFIPLQYIDTSTLRSHEDVISIILSRMLMYLSDEIEQPSYIDSTRRDSLNQEEIRRLYQQFGEVYNSLCNLNKGIDGEERESPLRSLRRLTSSYTVARDFRKLVDNYLEFFNRLDFGTHRRSVHYLVFSFDDIDMYEGVKGREKTNDARRHAYELLEEIYEFLMIPGVVVLMTYNHSVLNLSGGEYLQKKYSRLLTEEMKSEILQQFLLKTLPTWQRIYMPNFERYVKEQGQLYIGLGEQSVFGMNQGREQDKEYPLKAFMLCMVAYQTGIYMDGCGQKNISLKKATYVHCTT